MSRETPVSLWDASAEERDPRGVPLSAACGTDALLDVAIVGGGFTGLSTALHCAQQGLGAHVLEARHVGFGGSGRNVGLVNAGAWLPPARIGAYLGKTYGPRFVERFGRGPQTVFDLIERHQIRCEATRTGTVHAAHGPSGFRDLQSRHAEWRRLDAPVELLDRDEVHALSGTRHFHGGLLDHRAGTINPMGYCRGLARAAEAAGARLSVGVQVRKLIRDGTVWQVETDQGSLRARNVVLGTNAYTDGLWPGLKSVFTTIHYLQVATTPLGPEAAHILPGRQGLWDTGRVMFNYRRDAADRLLIGTMGRVIGTKERGLTRRWAERQLRKVFPELGPLTFEDAWHGQIAMTPSHLPQIHQLDEGVWTAIGYNGRGITTGTLFGQAMAELLTGADPADLPLPLTRMSAAPRAGMMTRVYDMAFTANQLWKSL
jgi:glycine/D-amino acid oxidase-like deaminating enzyme